MTLPFVPSLITAVARREFSRAMHFEAGWPVNLPPSGRSAPRLLYLHIPFCEQLCPYCSFNRVVFEPDLCRAYFRALRREIRLYAERGYDFGGIYVGGGTPTVLPDELGETLALARASFGIREISVETNPNHLTDETLALLKKAGVNRLSVGVQSFQDPLLRQMERYAKYGSGEVIARRLGEIAGRFDTLNADMIFNFPSQTPEMLAEDLAVIRSLGVDQVTWYPLMVSDATRRKVSRTLGRVRYSRERRYYGEIVKGLLPMYRLSSAWCFSRQPSLIDEYIVDYAEYAGLGSGSIGYLDGTCYANTFRIPDYIAQVERGEIPLFAARAFSRRDRIRYDFLMQLFGMTLDIRGLKRRYGPAIWRHLWFPLLAFGAAGGLRYRPPVVRLTAAGRYLWVIMMREFFIAVNNFRDDCRDGPV
jgi:coproporphyrinogen III oxidase-like Fe-S oxidoreductase